MQTSFLTALLLITETFFPVSVRAGQIVYSTAYVPQTLVQGEGNTIELATKDAHSAIPAGYKVDKENPASLECTISGDMLRISRGEKCDMSITGNRYRVTQPILLIEPNSQR